MLQCTGFSLQWLLLLWSRALGTQASVVVAHGLSCSTACGIFPDQGSNPSPLHWQVDSLTTAPPGKSPTAHRLLKMDFSQEQTAVSPKLHWGYFYKIIYYFVKTPSLLIFLVLSLFFYVIGHSIKLSKHFPAQPHYLLCLSTHT